MTRPVWAWLVNLGAAAALFIGVSIGPDDTGAQLKAAESNGWTTQDAEIGHVLNRISFGPKAEDLERVRKMGIARYIDEQLHPERIADADVSARLRGMTTLPMSNREISEIFAQPLLRARAERRRDAANDSPAGGALGAPNAAAGSATADPMMPPQERRGANLSPEDRELQQRAQLPLMELSQQKILRAVYSDRQLQEVLTDFWFNHFNVDARKGQSRFMLTEYEREAIRPRVLGSFRDLLGATAKSPAMLFYLDNWMSADPAGPHIDRNAMRRGAPGGVDGSGNRRPGVTGARPGNRGQGQGIGQGQGQGAGQGQGGGQGQNARRGLNENYGRELLELHTLGVDGGYTQKDVTEVARAFTGWTIENPRSGGGFRFVAALHDNGKKIVLGHTIESGGGQKDGEQVLDLLAAHPATARFISTALASRFVRDDPPADLVDRMAATFTRTKGDLRAVMTTLLTSREFLSPDSYRAKVKTPLEFVVSALRATDADVADAGPAVRWLQQLGMPLYQCQPPTGYKDHVDTWVNTGALVNRMNVALALTNGSTRAIRVGAIKHPESLIAGAIAPTTRDTIARASTPAQAAALGLGAPEFQRR